MAPLAGPRKNGRLFSDFVFCRDRVVAKIWQNLDLIFLTCSRQTELHLGNALFEFK